MDAALSKDAHAVPWRSALNPRHFFILYASKGELFSNARWYFMK